ncbi:hypothetical protein QTP88_027139 [Uroleucon formosanum]
MPKKYTSCQRNLCSSLSKRVINQQPRRGNAIGEDIEVQILAHARANPRTSIRHVSREINISFGVVQKILKKHKMHAYRADLVQHLREGDAERRITFIAWLETQLNENPYVLNYILWTDESKFPNNGVLNKQNHRYWDDQNPHWTFETNNQSMWGTNVWCGLINGKLLGPYFYDGTLNGRRYHDFLLNELPNMLDDLPLDIRANLIFQQDGAPAHNANIVRNQLNEYFPNRWLGTYGAVQWPPRSPDLTPLDYFLWSHLKTVVYANPPTCLLELKNKILAACNQITEEQIISAINREFLIRVECCLQHHGAQFEQFVR